MTRLSLRARRALRDLPVAVIQAPKGSVLVIEAVDHEALDSLLPVAVELSNRTGLYAIATIRDEATLRILRPGDPFPVPLADASDRMRH